MSKGIMTFLQRAGLVEKEPDPVVVAPAAPQPEPVSEELVLMAATPQEAVNVAEVYAAAGVPKSPYPAERFLKLLDGLRAMDENTRKVAIAAMDTADDSWTVADAVADARAKIEALTTYSRGISESISSAKETAVGQVAELRQVQAEVLAEIQEKMDALAKEREAAIARISQEIKDTEVEAFKTEQGLNKNLSQVGTVVADLSTIIKQFGADAAGGAASSI